MQNGEYRVAANELFVKMTTLDGILLSLDFLHGKQRSLEKLNIGYQYAICQVYESWIMHRVCSTFLKVP